jgi:hypothetical protein
MHFASWTNLWYSLNPFLFLSSCRCRWDSFLECKIWEIPLSCDIVLAECSIRYAVNKITALFTQFGSRFTSNRIHVSIALRALTVAHSIVLIYSNSEQIYSAKRDWSDWTLKAMIISSRNKHERVWIIHLWQMNNFFPPQLQEMSLENVYDWYQRASMSIQIPAVLL